MPVEVSEQSFEQAIERALLRGGPDAYAGDATRVREPTPAYGDEPMPGGYLKRTSDDFDRALCLIPKDTIDFLVATQIVLGIRPGTVQERCHGDMDGDGVLGLPDLIAILQAIQTAP